MNVLRNAWYALALSAELGPSPFSRTVANIRIVAFRTQAGTPVALRDRCAHRFVPLSMGQVAGDAIQCPYHGLRYGPDGTCVHSPIEGNRITPGMRVRSFPLLERYAVLWIWLGEAELADPALLPDFAFLDDPRRGNVGGSMHTRANYELVVDNLTDLTHVQFVHAEFQASEVFGKLTHTVRREGDAVVKSLLLPNGKPPPTFAGALPTPDTPVDLRFETCWFPPSLVRLSVSATVPGQPDEVYFQGFSAHLVTPETEGTCFYIYINSRDHRVGDPEVDAHVREWQRIGFGEQDKPMLEAQQAAVGGADLFSLRPVMMPTDAGAVRARRILAVRIAEENRHHAAA